MLSNVRTGVLLAAYTTLKVGGPAQWFVTVDSIAALKAAVQFAKANALPLFVLGGGSNVLVCDTGYEGLVIHMCIPGSTYTTVSDTAVHLEVGAGVLLDECVEDTVRRGYWGLENLSHIPGTVGATPVQNVGAYGVEVGQCIVSVTALHVPSETVRVFTNAECVFGYRDSFFKTPAGQEYIITAVTFSLERQGSPRCTYADLAEYFGSTQPTQAMVREAVIAIRRRKFPDWQRVGTAGSFFKNPIIARTLGEALRARYPLLPLYDVDAARVKCSLGFILDKVCGLRGYHEGAVALFEKQALVLVVEPGATATDIIAFAEMIARKVKEETAIEIEWEVTLLKN